MVRWFLIANACHARLVQQDGPGPLVPVGEFDHPAGRHAVKPRDRAGWRLGSAHMGGAALQGGQEARQRERERFAAELADALEEGARQRRFARLAIFAGPGLLGELRPRLGPLTRGLLDAECPVDLAHVGWAELGPRIDAELQHAGWLPTGRGARAA